MRFFAICGVLFPLPLLTGLAVAGLRGMGLAFVLTALGAAIAALRAERALVRTLGKLEPPTAGLLQSLRMASAGLETDFPDFWVAPFAQPQCLVLRGFLGNGNVILTRGLIATLEESELRALLRGSILSSNAAGLPLRTFAAFLAQAVIRITPNAVMHCFFKNTPLPSDDRGRITPASVLRFWTLLPVTRVLIRASRGAARAPDAELALAFKRITQNQSPCQPLQSPAFRHLLMVDTQGSADLIGALQ